MGTTVLSNPMGALAPLAADRLHAMDALRGGALLLGVGFHATYPFLGVSSWAIREDISPILQVFYLVTHIFRMTLFFMIAGFFGRMLMERRGAVAFIRDRVTRILLPLLVFLPLILAAIMLAYHWGFAVMTALGEKPDPEMLHVRFGLRSFPLTHLWFLYVLTLFYAPFALVHFLGRFATMIDAFARRRVDRVFGQLAGSPLAPAFAAAPLFTLFCMRTFWVSQYGIPAPDHGLIPSLEVLVGYGTAFVFGWVLHRNPALLAIFERRWRSNLTAAGVLTAFVLTLYAMDAPLHSQPGRVALAACYSGATWAWVLGLVGLAFRYLPDARPGVRYVADASYWIYIMHQPVLMAFHVWLAPLSWYPVEKFAVVLAASLAVLFASYHWLVRSSWLGAWLNGHRSPPQPAR